MPTLDLATRHVEFSVARMIRARVDWLGDHSDLDSTEILREYQIAFPADRTKRQVLQLALRAWDVSARWADDQVESDVTPDTSGDRFRAAQAITREIVRSLERLPIFFVEESKGEASATPAPAQTLRTDREARPMSATITVRRARPFSTYAYSFEGGRISILTGLVTSKRSIADALVRAHNGAQFAAGTAIAARTRVDALTITSRRTDREFSIVSGSEDLRVDITEAVPADEPTPGGEPPIEPAPVVEAPEPPEVAEAPTPVRIAILKGRRTARRLAARLVTWTRAKATQAVYEAHGATEFRWRTVGDNRVRPLHAEIDGRRYPIATGHPTEGLPGQPYNCRCFMVLIT